LDERGKKKKREKKRKKAFMMSKIYRIRLLEGGLQSTELSFGHHINK